jgi:ketosteroid isomerase-like protein
MSQANVEVVERFLEDFVVTGQLSDLVARDVIWDMSNFGGWPDQPLFHGFDGFAEFMSAWREPYDDWSMAVEQILDAGGDEVVAVVTQRGQLPGSDADVGQRYGIVYTVENRQIRRGQAYTTPEQALEAVGLRE